MTLAEASHLLAIWVSQKPADVAAQKAALDYYGNYFRPENLPKVTEEGFKEFLLLKNNKHWTGIHRQPNIYANMDRLRTSLAVLLDEKQPIESRLGQDH
jgi:hypothetical protein